MGTTSEWIGALKLGAFWGVGMFVLDAISGRKMSTRLLDLAALAFGSLLFGMLMEFGWRRVLHGGIAVVLAIAILGLVVVGLAVRRARKRSLS